MTKAQEIEIIKAAAEKLGPDSYLGPWLAEQLPALEMDLRADCFTRAMTYREAQEFTERTKRQAEEDSKRILSTTIADCEKREKEAMRECRDIRTRLSNDIRQALRLLES